MQNRYFSTFYHDQYINDQIDTTIFNELTSDYKGLFEPLEFFNLLKKQFDFVNSNKENPTLCIEHLVDLSINKSQLLFLLRKLELLIELFIKYGIVELNETDKLRSCIYLLSEQREKLDKELNSIRTNEKSNYSNPDEVLLYNLENKDINIDIKPRFKPEIIDQLFDILKDFFIPEDQPALKYILETGNNSVTKLLFRDNGNRLADTFKKLIEYDFIPGCEKQDLQKWVISNFNYLHRKKIKEYLPETIEKTISRNDNPCKSPLIEIKNGQILKVEHPRSKKQNRY